MPMIRADSIISDRVRDILPEDMKNIPYVTAKEGMIGVISKVVFSTYEVMEKDDAGNIKYDPETKQAIPRKNLRGEQVYNTTAYVLFDGKLTSFNGSTALKQLVSISGEYVRNKVDVATYDTEPVKVKLINIEESFGSKKFPKLAFEPIEE